jgi:hypothetical protein
MTDSTYDVFISYSSKDADWVRGTLLQALEEAGLRVYIDFRDFEIGTPSLVNMERGVEESRHTLVVLTPNWISSEWTEFESLLVGTSDPAGRRRKLIPLMLAKCDLPPRIAMLTYVDFTQDNLDLSWQRLLRGLGAPSASAPPAAPRRAEAGPRTAAPAGDGQEHDLVDLRDKLIDRCDLGDLRNLCFSMGLDYDNYPSAKQDFIIALLNDLRRKGRVDEFIRVLRADAPWVLR